MTATVWFTGRRLQQHYAARANKLILLHDSASAVASSPPVKWTCRFCGWGSHKPTATPAVRLMLAGVSSVGVGKSFVIYDDGGPWTRPTQSADLCHLSLSLSLSACPINAVGEQICITRTRALMQIARFTEFLIILYLFTNEIADRKQQNKSEKNKKTSPYEQQLYTVSKNKTPNSCP